jgi:hypothetical protein
MTRLKQKQRQKGQAISVQCVEGGGVADQSKICHFFFFFPSYYLSRVQGGGVADQSKISHFFFFFPQLLSIKDSVHFLTNFSRLVIANVLGFKCKSSFLSFRL